jgi:D-alanyl-D-alanine carboxypeptidase
MRAFFGIIIFAFGLTFQSSMASAQTTPTGRYASIIVDAQSLDIIHARQIDAARYPASLTKVMTLYLTFDAISSGQLKLDDRLTVSSTAAATAPTKLGLRKGQTISVDTLIRAVAVRSANDAAVVLAEHLRGSESDFAVLMTAKARQLGMQRTIFRTANGLPHPEQITTARDMAKLANAMLSHHKRFYHYFGLMSFEYRGRTYRNTNKLLRQREDVDGFKTGYTRDSGYNLIVSAERDGRRLIAVVLGGASGASRNSHMSDLIDRGFDVIKSTSPIVTLAETRSKQGYKVEDNEVVQSQLRTIPAHSRGHP